jgi:hypothetical protein
MTSLGKKILSAFVEVSEDRATQGAFPSGQRQGANPAHAASGRQDENPAHAPGSGQGGPVPGVDASQSLPGKPAPDGRFRDYFDQLFAGANMPGPDYYEFSKMILAMQAIPDEQARFRAAYAGLQAQGLDREKLLSTAGEYLRMLATDADNFHATADQAMREKVHGRAAELKEKNDRIGSLEQEIRGLRDQITALQAGIKENEEKIEASAAGYRTESGGRQARIQDDIEKIRHYIL